MNKSGAVRVDPDVNTNIITKRVFRGALTILLAVGIGAGTSCMTTYDAYGRPVQSVDPGVAVAGVAAAGLIGYSMHHGHHGHHYSGHHHYRPYGGYHCR